MGTNTSFSTQKSTLSLAALLICFGIITQNMPRIFLNYAKSPYTLSYFLTVFALAAAVMICGLFISNPSMNARLQSKWIRVLCFFLLSPLWISPSIETAMKYVQPLSLMLRIDTERLHLWFGWLVGIGVALLLAQWFAYSVEHRKEMTNLLLPSGLLAACILLLITFSDATLLSVIFIFAAALLACCPPRALGRVRVSKRRSQVKPSIKHSLAYLGCVFFIGLSYQILESISYTSNMDVEPNYIYLIACLFIILTMIMQLHATRNMQKDTAPNIKLILILLLAFGAIIIARTFWVSIVNSFPFDLLYGASCGAYVLAAIGLQISLLLLLFRTADYLQGNTLKHLLQGKSVFLFGMAAGIIIVSLFASSAFFTKDMGPETIAFIALVCAIFLASFFSLSNRDSIMRALFGDGELPNNTLFLEKVPLKAQYLAKKYGLNQTEAIITELIASSHSSKQIADRLFFSKNTIPGYRDNIFKKLGVHSKEEVIDLFDAITDEDLGLSENAQDPEVMRAAG